MGVGVVAELRISDLSGQPGGQRRVRVAWREEQGLPREAEAVFAEEPDAGDGERVRWYLEDYAEFPADPAPVIARQAEARLEEQGAALFRRVFEANRDTMRVWDAAAESLAGARVEVDVDPGAGPGLAWELLRDPVTDAAVALGAGAFVRTHHQAARQPVLPEPSGDRLRVLLVIARPGGRADVPFRSVASRLVRGGADQMEGLDLDVLRPATFARMSRVLHEARDAGRPYHVVHFDGHGTWLDLERLGVTASPGATGGGGGTAGLALSRDRYAVSVAGPVRAGQHGYLLFEDPQGTADGQGTPDPRSTENQQLVDGPTLGRLLADTGVPVLVLNACRSAYSEALSQPADVPGPAAEDGEAGVAAGPGPSGVQAGGEGVLTADVHARIRAYGSLAAEVTDAGVPGVVAMRYNVYVVTAAQFMSDLYAHLLAGRSLGQAAAAARRALAADPVRQIGVIPVSLQDWAVPIIYESRPLVLLRPQEQHEAPLVKLTLAESPAGDGGTSEVPRPPDAGFFGRDETLLALDRAFDTQSIVLLHAFAGAGKSATAAEFARWYRATGGLDLPGQPDWPGAVMWSSFEHHLTADRVIGAAGDYFAGVLEANDIQWAAITDPAQRRDIVMQVLAQVPVLWVWDNVEPVAGFPEDTQSDWTTAEQDGLVNLLRDLAQRTRCKVLVTSRRDEHAWLGDLPARVQLPPMPVRESVQLAGALAARHGQSLGTADWRPLLRYAAGNPLTLTVLVGQALRSGLATTDAIEGFVAGLRTGEAELEAGEDAALGRSRSLAASLSYGFEKAFTEAERTRLAALHLFRDAANADALRYMGNQRALGDDSVPELAELDYEAAVGLMDRAAGIGLLESLGGGYYRIHPALPWYFTTLFTASYGPPGSPSAQRATRAYTKAIGDLGSYYISQAEAGHTAQVIPALRVEEGNLRQALDLGRANGLWQAVIGCLHGLDTLYDRTGRGGEWARLVAAIAPDFTDPATGGPLPGREEYWTIVTEYRARLAWQARDWATATSLNSARVTFSREQAAEALAIDPASLTRAQRDQIRNLAVSLEDLAQILRDQEDPQCLPYYQEALSLLERIDGKHEQAELSINLGKAYVVVPGLRDLDQGEKWYRHSLGLRTDEDQLGQVKSLLSLGGVALLRFEDGRPAGEADEVLLGYLNDALNYSEQALELLPPDDHEQRAITENHLGAVYHRAGDIGQALRHYQLSIQHEEARGNIFGAGQTRFNIALLLADDGRIGDALHYARAALDNYQQVGPGAADRIAETSQLIADLEQSSR